MVIFDAVGGVGGSGSKDWPVNGVSERCDQLSLAALEAWWLFLVQWVDWTPKTGNKKIRKPVLR